MAKLSNLERGIIVSYLVEEHVMLNVFCQDEQNQIQLETGKNGVMVLKDGIITVNNPPPALTDWARAGTKVNVVFYFRKLGLSFDCAIEKTSGGLQFAIPAEISRLEEKAEKNKQVTANLYFSLSGNKDMSFSCSSIEHIPLFKTEVWQALKNFPNPERAAINTAQALKQCRGISITQVSKTVFGFLEKTQRLLYKTEDGIPAETPFDFDVCVTKNDVPNKNTDAEKLIEEIAALPHKLYMPLDGDNCLCAALETEITQETIEQLFATVNAAAFTALEAAVFEPILDRVGPLSIVFLSDKFIVLGGKSESFPLKKGQEYAIQIVCVIPNGKRIIHTTLAVNDVVSRQNAESLPVNCAAVCVFTGIQAEDRRFLFEKLYGTIFK